ncbi:helix-turn-helix transcriptional regulator [Vibrio sp. 404]|uniref:Helix-turn-helix transcriptional regulator n=1 Tax=Vibrio marinisediminis TaxID=2758441 RepID=A0A7W2IU40_9VIBR|nr:AraC family transcriptional regulator [Vibrio marinisediminis]MBA5763180.1 helix-turn-helix transcriptional regulator [Vibrio marinisediminis]
MTNTAPYILVPEYTLLKNLPLHQRKRFEIALDLMHSEERTGLAWQEIAAQSAISPYHFHRHFTRVFHETPGNYLSRIQLQWAVSMLLESPSIKVTDVAFECGYSSSQALAKALKRELNLTAKAIKAIGLTGSVPELKQVLEPLGHRVTPEDAPLEIQLAENLPCRVEEFEQRAIRLEKIPDEGFDTLCDILGSKICDLAMLTPVKMLDQPWNIDCHWVGKWCPPNHKAVDQKIVPSGEFLVCECYIASDMGYLSALEGMEKQGKKMGLKPYWEGICVEQVLELDNSLTGGIVLRIEVPVIWETQN